MAVTPFGTLCDRWGRRPVLLVAHGITAACALGFALTRDMAVIPLLQIGFGVSAAALIASSLALVADQSTPDNRGRLMGFFDMFALGGVAGGFLLATLLSVRLAPDDPTIDTKIFLLAAVGSVVSAAVVAGLVRETRVRTSRLSAIQMLRTVLGRGEVLRLLPVYIPIIAIYGMVLAFTRRLLEENEVDIGGDAFLILALIGSGLIVSMLVSGILSDRTRLRHPFILVGLICFGDLAVLLLLHAERITVLVTIWPLVLLLSLGAGAFPPAVLAYLSDISKHETRGTTFGVYSLVFGTGMIIGPVVGGVALARGGAAGFGLVMALLVGTACAATLSLREYAAMEAARRRPSPSADSDE